MAKPVENQCYKEYLKWYNLFIFILSLFLANHSAHGVSYDSHKKVQLSWWMNEFKQGLTGTFQITGLWIIELMFNYKVQRSGGQKTSPVQCLFKLIPGMYSTVTLDWFAVFLMTMLLWQSELKSPAYRFPLSRRCHSNGGTATASMFVVSLAPSLVAAKWKKTSRRLIYMVMVWSPTFCPRPVANQMAKYGLCSQTFPTVRTSVSMTVGVSVCFLPLPGKLLSSLGDERNAWLFGWGKF